MKKFISFGKHDSDNRTKHFRAKIPIKKFVEGYINTLDDEKLEAELTRAVQEEDYRLASYIKEELNRRKYKNSN